MDFEKIEIRTPNLSDAKNLGEFAKEKFIATFGHLYHPDDLKEFLNQKYNTKIMEETINNKANFIKIALYDNSIIGYILGGPMGLPFENAHSKAYELQRLYVDEIAKGTGLAKLLYQSLLHHTKTLNAPELYLGVWAENHRALKFYSNLGFEIVGKYLYQVGRTFDDERIMRLKL